MKYSIVLFNNNNLKSNLLKINEKLEHFNYDIIVLNLNQSNIFFPIVTPNLHFRTIYIENNEFKTILKTLLNHKTAPYLIFINSNDNNIIDNLDKIVIDLMKLNNKDNKNQMLILQSNSCNCFQKQKIFIYAFIKNTIKKLDLNQDKNIFEIYQEYGYTHSIQYTT